VFEAHLLHLHFLFMTIRKILTTSIVEYMKLLGLADYPKSDLFKSKFLRVYIIVSSLKKWRVNASAGRSTVYSCSSRP
jgi:hypothetical protein